VVEVFLPTDRATGRPRGFAFVEFTTSEGVAAAIERFDGAELGGRKLRINRADSVPRRPSFAPAPGPPPGRRFGKGKGSRRGLRGRKRSL